MPSATGTVPPTTSIFTSMKNGELWVQPDGPNTQPVLLGCFELGDIQQPEGEITKVQAVVGGAFKTRGTVRRPPGNVTFSLDDFLPRTLSYIESLTCPAAFYVQLRDCGRAGIFSNWARSLVLKNAYRSATRYVGLVKMKEEAESHVTGEFAADYPVLKFVRPAALRQSTSETGNLLSVSFCSDDSCNVPGCATATHKGDFGYVAGSVPYVGSTADVVNTDDAGAVWAASSKDPFGAGMDIAFIKCFPIGSASTRVIVGRKTAVGGDPAEIAYSDDAGATWTNVHVGAVNGQFFMGGQSIFVFDLHHIWVVTNDGYVYFSADSGATWTAQESGVITAGNLNAIHMADDLVGVIGGAANILATTINGLNWSAVAGPVAEAGNAVLSVHVTDKFRFWATYSTGNVYCTKDGGVTWEARSSWTGAGTGTVPCIRFTDEYSGWFIHNTAAPVGSILHTINGGYDWELITPSIANAGLNDIVAIDENMAYVVGNAYGGTGVILKVYAA